jgi:hypothetical protein
MVSTLCTYDTDEDQRQVLSILRRIEESLFLHGTSQSVPDLDHHRAVLSAKAIILMMLTSKDSLGLSLRVDHKKVSDGGSSEEIVSAMRILWEGIADPGRRRNQGLVGVALNRP